MSLSLITAYLFMGHHSFLRLTFASAFTFAFFQEFCNFLHIAKRYATNYHPAGKGAVESTFHTYQNTLSKWISIPTLTSAYQMTGETPFFLMFGRDPGFPIENNILPEKCITYIG